MEEVRKKKEFFKKLQEFCCHYSLLATAILLGIIGISAFFITAYFDTNIEIASELTLYKIDNIFLNSVLIFLFIGFVSLFVKIMKNVKIKYIIFGTLIITFIAQLLWVLNLKFIPESDQGAVVICANSFLQHSFEQITQPTGYLNMFPYQTGISLFITIIYKIFGTQDPIILQIFNVIFSTANLGIMYLILAKIFQKDSIRKIGILLLFGFSLYFLFFNPHVYGNIVGLMFVLIAIYYTIIYLQQKHIYPLFIIAISVTLAILLKSNYNVFLCGIAVVLFLEFLKNKKIVTIAGIGICLLTLLFSQKTLDYAITKITGYENNQGVPMLSYIYMGMAPKVNLSCGWYTADVITIYQRNNYHSKEASKESMELIKNRLNEFWNNPGEMLQYYTDKLASTWLNPTFQTIWTSNPGIRLQWHPEYNQYLSNKKIVQSMLCGKLYGIEEQFFNTFQIIMFLSSAYAMWEISKKKELETSLLAITFLGGFFFHILWETKAIYVIQYYFLLIPFAAYGVDKLNEKITKIIGEKKNVIRSRCKIY